MKCLKSTIFLFFALVFFTPFSQAQETTNSGKAQFYEATTADKIIAILPPRNDQDRTFGGGTNFFSGSGKCPDEINIGSVTDESTIFGGVDNSVFIDGSIVIQCN